jgi:hypothetical protein
MAQRTRPWRQGAFDVGETIQLVLQFGNFALAVLQLNLLLAELASSLAVPDSYRQQAGQRMQASAAGSVDFSTFSSKATALP